MLHKDHKEHKAFNSFKPGVLLWDIVKKYRKLKRNSKETTPQFWDIMKKTDYFGLECKMLSILKHTCFYHDQFQHDCTGFVTSHFINIFKTAPTF